MMKTDTHESLCMDVDRTTLIYVCKLICACIQTCMYEECKSWQDAFQTRNTKVAIDVKEELWLPNENITVT